MHGDWGCFLNLWPTYSLTSSSGTREAALWELSRDCCVTRADGKGSTATTGTHPVPAPLLSPGELQEVLGPMGFVQGALEVPLYALS